MDTLTPEQLAREGTEAYKKGDFLAAAQAFQAAAESYAAGGDHLNAAEMKNNCSVAYLQAGEAEAALRAVEGTVEVFAAAGDLRRQGLAAGNLGAALEELDRFEEAAQAYQQSAEALEKAGEDALRAHVMQSLSSVQLRTGKHLQAVANMQSGLEGVKRPTPQQRMLKRLLQIPFNMLNKNS